MFVNSCLKKSFILFKVKIKFTKLAIITWNITINSETIPFAFEITYLYNECPPQIKQPAHPFMQFDTVQTHKIYSKTHLKTNTLTQHKHTDINTRTKSKHKFPKNTYIDKKEHIYTITHIWKQANTYTQTNIYEHKQTKKHTHTKTHTHSGLIWMWACSQFKVTCHICPLIKQRPV